jgi:hypothetical protein
MARWQSATGARRAWRFANAGASRVREARGFLAGLNFAFVKARALQSSDIATGASVHGDEINNDESGNNEGRRPHDA